VNRREKTLALVATCVVLGWLGLPQLHAIFIAPIEDKQFELNGVNEELATTTQELADVNAASRTLKQWRGRSLPPSPLDAQRHYQDWMTDLAQLVGFEELKVTPGRTAAQGDAYTGVHVLLEGKAKMSHVGEFLYHFYRTDLPQRIVSINIECPEAKGDPMLSVSLTAEGLAIGGVARREYLFPTAKLADGFTSSTSGQEIKVADDGDFPEGVPLRIRIGNEYLTVLGREESRWTVEGGRDATSPVAHAADDVIELAPVWPEYADISLDDFRRLVGSSPFVKPAPETPPKKPEEVVRQDDAVKDTYLAASILTGGEPTAWLYRRSKSERTVIRKESELNVGELHAVVLDIQADHVVIRQQDTSWRLSMGDSLSTMQKLPAEEEGEKPADDAAAESPASEAPASETSSSESPASEAAASEVPASDDLPTENAPPEDTPAEDELTEEKSTKDESVEDEPAEDGAASEADEPVSERS
jgi:hypothetical protein